MELYVAYHTKVILNSLYQKIYKIIITNITTRQDLLLLNDSLHDSNGDFTEHELNIKEIQKSILD